MSVYALKNVKRSRESSSFYMHRFNLKNQILFQLLRIERECGNTAAVDQLLATQRRLGLPVAS